MRYKNDDTHNIKSSSFPSHYHFRVRFLLFFFHLKSENSNEVHTTWLPRNLQWKAGLSQYIFNQGGSRHMNSSLETCCMFHYIQSRIYKNKPFFKCTHTHTHNGNCNVHKTCQSSNFQYSNEYQKSPVFLTLTNCR